MHFWQNDRDFLHATAVTRRWNSLRWKVGMEGAGCICQHNYFSKALMTEIIMKSVIDKIYIYIYIYIYNYPESDRCV